jgi:3-oxoacyl-(acyl-carrier-protein) synthase
MQRCVSHEPPILALKGSIGHSIAACGVVELIAALYCLRAGRVEGAFGLSQRDPALPAPNISPFDAGSRPLSGRVALCNTFAFGGINCSLLVGAP